MSFIAVVGSRQEGSLKKEKTLEVMEPVLPPPVGEQVGPVGR